jgi:RNA polymerase sigma-19 factor, ECF subfamily
MALALTVTRRKTIVDRLIRTHHSQLTGFLRRMLGSAAIAEEVAQDTYEKFLRWEKLEERPIVAQKAALFRSGRRLAIDHLRRVQSGARADLLAEAGHTEGTSNALAQPERQVMLEQVVTRLTQIIDSLPDRLREPFNLRYVDEWPPQAICAHLGITIDNYHHRIMEARRICAERMASSGFDWRCLD